MTHGAAGIKLFSSFPPSRDVSRFSLYVYGIHGYEPLLTVETYLNGGSGGWICREEPPVDLVHSPEVLHVAQVDSNLDHITHGCPCSLQYRPDVVHGLPGLGLYIFPHCLVGLGIEGAGSRYVDLM